MKNNFLHSLGFKLLLVNFIAPLVLIGGLFMLSGYKEALEKAEFKNLETQAELIALSFDNYGTIMRGISKLPQFRLQIFSENGQLLADSKNLFDGYIVELSSLIATLTEGKIIKNIDNNKNIMSIIVPVFDVDESIKGAVRVYTSAAELNQKMMDLRKGLLFLSGITFVITIVLSLFLAHNIGYPLNDLAAVAKQIKAREKVIDIPDYSNRKDEIGRLSIAFQSMLQTINNKLNSFESFASDVTHEIKNPLTSILSATQTVQKITDPEKKAKLIQIISDDVQRLDRLITDISSLSKISANVDNETLEKIKLAPMIKEFSQLYQFNDKNQKVIVKYDKSIENIRILAKETRLAQIFNNLVGNALSFSEEGAEVVVEISKKNKDIVVSVIDTGKGLVPGTEEKIFDRFYHDRSENQSKHSGLGLSLTKTIVEGMGGKIYASANQPKGAVFVIELPIVQEKR